MVAAVEAEVERRVAAKHAELDARRAELDRMLDKLTERTTVTSAEVSDSDSVTSAPRGAPSYQLDFIFNHLRPRSMGVMWPMLRAAFNAEPARFELASAHVSSSDPIPHYTIYYKCPVHKHDGNVAEYILKIHVRYVEVSGARPKFTSVWAQTLANSTVPQEIASFV